MPVIGFLEHGNEQCVYNYVWNIYHSGKCSGSCTRDSLGNSYRRSSYFCLILAEFGMRSQIVVTPKYQMFHEK